MMLRPERLWRVIHGANVTPHTTDASPQGEEA